MGLSRIPAFAIFVSIAMSFSSGLAAQIPPQTGTQITTSGNCTINIIRSSARDVRVTGCVEQSARIAVLQNTINAIFANQSVEISRIDDMIAAMNLFFAENAKNQLSLLEASAESNDKITKILDFLESFQEKPEDAAGLIPLLTDGTLSHIQEKRPFAIQLVRVVEQIDRYGEDFRVVLRLVKSGPEDFRIAIRTNRIERRVNFRDRVFVGDRAEGWSILGLYGTTCTIDLIDDVTTIASHYDLRRIEDTPIGEASTTLQLPLTLIVKARCSGRVQRDDLALNLRFFVKPLDGSQTDWSTVDFRFDASKITKLQPGSRN
jgi:hypothetical protein